MQVAVSVWVDEDVEQQDSDRGRNEAATALRERLLVICIFCLLVHSLAQLR